MSAIEAPPRATPTSCDEARLHEAAIVNSRRFGIITETEHDAQLKALRDPTQTATLSHVPMRSKGQKTVRDFTGQWFKSAGPFESYALARAAIPTVNHGGNGGEWASNQTGKHGWYHCNRHLDAGGPCPVQLKIAKLSDNTIWLMTTDKIQHGLEMKAVKRKNSRLTFEVLRMPLMFYGREAFRAPSPSSEGLDTRGV